MSDNLQERVAILEVWNTNQDKQITDNGERLDSLERSDSEKVGLLAKLGQTVETLAITVTTLNTLTAQIDKDQTAMSAKFNIIIAILGCIGVAVISAVVKLLFFSGVAG